MLEHFIAHQVDQTVGIFDMAKLAPAQMLFVFFKTTGKVSAGAGGAFFVAAFVDVQQFGEHQEGDLFDDGQGVGDAALPEFQPEFVDFVFKFAGDHVYLFCNCRL